MTIRYKSKFESSRAKVNATVAIFRKNIFIALALPFINCFKFYCTQMCSMITSGTTLSFSFLGLRSRSQWIFSEKKISFITLAPKFMDRFSFNTQLLIMAISWTSLCMSIPGLVVVEAAPLHPSNFIVDRPKAALLFWFFGGFRCGVPLCIVILVIYKYRNR